MYRAFVFWLFLTAAMSASFVATAESQVVKVPVLKIGLILPLTGPTADYGESIRNSVEMARGDHPEDFNRVQFLYEDARYDTALAVSAFQKLVSVDRVDLIYTWGITFCRALGPLAEARKIPLIVQCLDSQSAAGRRYVMRFMNYSDEYQQLIADYLEKKKLRRIAMVISDNTYLEEMYEALRRASPASNSIEIVARYHTSEMNFRSTISKIKNGNFDAIGVYLGPGQVAQFYRQLREQNLQLPTFGTNLSESLSEVRAAEGSMEGAIFSFNIETDQFHARYVASHNKASQLAFGALAYEFASLVGRILRTSNVSSGVDLLAQLRSTPPQQGIAAGPYKFQSNNQSGDYFKFPLTLKRIEGEKFVPVQF